MRLAQNPFSGLISPQSAPTNRAISPELFGVPPFCFHRCAQLNKLSAAVKKISKKKFFNIWVGTD